MPDGYRLWVNEQRTILVRIFDSPEQLAEVAFRRRPVAYVGATFGERP
jgi:hypothetical protein